MSQPERLPFLDEKELAQATPAGDPNKSDSKRIIELLEAIDWKMWMLYNMITKGELSVANKVKSMDVNETFEKKKLEKK